MTEHLLRGAEGSKPESILKPPLGSRLNHSLFHLVPVGPLPRRRVSEIGIVTPYKEQQRLLAKVTGRTESIGTVDSFQGQEKT